MSPDGRPDIRVELLGPVRVWRDGGLGRAGGPPAPGAAGLVGPARQPCRASRRAVDGLWGSDAGVAVNLVQTYVSAWRHALDPEWPARTATDRLSHGGRRLPASAGGRGVGPARLRSLGRRGARLLASGRTMMAWAVGARRAGSAESADGGPDRAAVRRPGRREPGGSADAGAQLAGPTTAWSTGWATGRGGSGAPARPAGRDPLRERLAAGDVGPLRLGRPAEALVLLNGRADCSPTSSRRPPAGLREKHAHVLRRRRRCGRLRGRTPSADPPCARGPTCSSAEPP